MFWENLISICTSFERINKFNKKILIVSNDSNIPFMGIYLTLLYFSDRFRTTINVVCDALGAIIVTSLSQNDIDKTRAVQNDREHAPAHELAELEKGDH